MKRDIVVASAIFTAFYVGMVALFCTVLDLDRDRSTALSVFMTLMYFGTIVAAKKGHPPLGHGG